MEGVPVIFSTFSAALVALAVSWLLTPLVRKVAFRFGALAEPNHRTIHKNSIPKLGGLAIYAGFLCSVLLLWPHAGFDNLLLALLVGGGMVACLGLLDDLYVLSCYTKLAVQSIAAAIAIYAGFSFEAISLPLAGRVELGMAALPLSALWIVGLMNALNLMDGVDGLASGFSIWVALVLCGLAVTTGQLELAAFTLVVAATTLGFLRYNLSPASIFMGDTGSLFLGFALSCLSIKIVTPQSGTIALLPALMIFAYPIMDMTLAVIRRVSTGQHPFWADRLHIHHRLLETGLKQPHAVLVILVASVIFTASGLLPFFLHTTWSIVPVSVVIGLSCFILAKLGCFGFFRAGWRKKEITIRFVDETTGRPVLNQVPPPARDGVVLEKESEAA